MSALPRLLAVARLRATEALRGPFAGFLLLYTVLAVAACLLPPGEAGPDRQRAVDRFALDAALLVTALAAAAFGAGSLPADRESGRASLIDTGPLRRHELLGAGLAGHAGALALLVAGAFAVFLLATSLLTGGAADRTATRVPIRAERLLSFSGEPAPHGVVLTEERPEATFLLPVGRREIERAAAGAGSVRAWVELRELYDTDSGIPVSYDVLVTVGDGPVRRITVGRGMPLSFELRPSEIRPGPDTPVAIRRIDPAMRFGLAPGGLLVEGPPRPFLRELGAAAFSWLLGLAVVAAAAAAFSTVLGAPVAVAGTLLFVLVGRSLSLLHEAAGYLAGESPQGRILAAGLRWTAAIWPDFELYDRTRPLVARWALPLDEVAARIPAALLSVLVLLAAARLLLAIRRRA